MAQRIKKSVIAGSWYPGDPRTLREEIERFFSRVPERGIGADAVVGIVAPHAGYDYSGQVAAHAYRQLRGISFDAVIVIGPSHRRFFRGVSVYPAGGYETPLGVVPVDEILAGDLIESGPVISAYAGGAYARAFGGDPASLPSGGARRIQLRSPDNGGSEPEHL